MASEAHRAAYAAQWMSEMDFLKANPFHHCYPYGAFGEMILAKDLTYLEMDSVATRRTSDAMS